MRKSISRKLATMLALVVLTTTFGSDYNSISVRATADDAAIEQTESESVPSGDSLFEEIPEEAPAEEVQENEEVSQEETVSEDASEENNEDASAEEVQENTESQESTEALETQENTETPEAVENQENAEASENVETQENTETTEAAPADENQNPEAPADETQSPEAPEDQTTETPEGQTEETPAATEETAEETTEAAPVEKLVTVTYKTTKGGSVSTNTETVDINKEGAAFAGSTATAWKNYEFTAWVDGNDEVVSTDATFVPSNLETDATYTAKFTAAEDIAESMPEIKESDVHAGGLIVSVDAEEGLFPKGTTVEIKGISESQAIETAQGELGDSVTSAVGVDITFWYEGNTIQPADEKFVHVNMALEEKIEGESFTVLHDHNGDVKPIEDAKIKSEDVNSDPADKTQVVTEVEFDSSEFSIYIVAGSTENKRVKVIFKNGDTEIASMYVKQGDKMEQVIYDPGAGVKPEGASFKGWKNVNDTEGNLLTIDQVRTEVNSMLPPTNDGEEVVYQAVFASGYTVTYVDEHGTSLGQHTVEYPAGATGDALNVEYKINMAYSPEDDEHNFEGWFITEDSSVNVVKIGEADYSYSAATAYGNGTKMTIKGSVTLSVNAPKGHWLIYESGKGGTYVAPDFVYSDHVTVDKTQDPTKPEDTTKIQMKKNGYTFGGWYTDETYSTKFTFGEELTDKTIVYAKWIANDTAGYTVLIWKEKLDGEYEFATSSVGIGKVGDSIKKIAIQEGTAGELKYVTVKKTDVQEGTGGALEYVTTSEKKFGGIENVPNGTETDPFTGFTYDKDSTKDGTINPEGTAVANIYFKRMTYTVNLYVAKKDGNSLKGSNLEGSGKYSGDWALTLSTITKINGHEPSQEGDYYYFPITAKYGADISSSWPTYASINSSREFISWILMKTAKMYARKEGESGGGKNTVKGHVGVMDEQILGDLSHSDGNYLTARYNNNSRIYNWTYYIYFKDVNGNYIKQDGKDGTVNRTVEAKSAQNGINSQHEPPFDGYIYETKDQYGGSGNDYHISFYYRPKEYSILYNDGVYGKGDDNEFVVEENLSSMELATRENILVGSDLKDYDIKPDHANRDGYIFDGWYKDESCHNKFDFENHVMTVGGLVLYAKWRKIQYRVFLHPNAGTQEDSPDLSWGSKKQEMNFRVSYGDKISTPVGTRSGYKFVGWYQDKGLTKLFNEDYVLNEDTVTETYDKDNHLTDTMDKWGNIVGPDEPKNNDKNNNRWWITREFNLYAKWRRVIEGADGIDVVYDLTDPDLTNGTGEEAVPGTGTGKAEDKNSYVDNASATAVPAVKAPAGYQFSHWVMQKYENDKYVDVDESVIYPGGEYKVLVSNARKESKLDESSNPIVDNESKPRYTYTIHIRAEYKKLGEETLTYIPWYKNDGSKAFHVDTIENGATKSTLKINEAVNIQAAPTLEGYKFLGWAKVDMGRTEAAADSFMTTESNWKQSGYIVASTAATPSIFLYYNNGNYYSDNTFSNDKKATQVAADEIMPYQALFAVWKEKVAITIDAVGKTVPYNGEEQSVAGYVVNVDGAAKIEPTEENAGNTFTIDGVTYTVEGIESYAAGTNVGEYPTEFSGQIKIMSGNEDVTDDFKVSYNTNKLIITPLKLNVSIIGNVLEVMYDGKEHEVTGYTVNNDSTGDVAKFFDESKVTFEGEASAKGTLVNTYMMNLNKDQFGYSDTNIEVTYTVEDGKLVIKDRIEGDRYQLMVSTDDDTRMYSGKTSTGADYDYKLEGSKPSNENANNVVAGLNSMISKALGAIKAHAADDPKGREIVIEDVKFYVAGLSVDVNARNVGVYDLAIAGLDNIKVVDENGNDVTKQFGDPIVKTGKLTITPKPIELTSASASKVYDGTALTNHNATANTEWGEGDAVTYNFTGSQTEVGTSKNLFTAVAANDLTKFDNYTITYVYGDLTVTKSTESDKKDDPTDSSKKKKKNNKTDEKKNDNNNNSDNNSSSDNSKKVEADRGNNNSDNAAVLGAKREAEEEQPGVLGARRAGTDDNTNSSRMIVLLIAAGAVATLLATGKKLRKHEE